MWPISSCCKPSVPVVAPACPFIVHSNILLATVRPPPPPKWVNLEILTHQTAFPVQLFLLADITRHVGLQCIKGSFYKANGKVMWCCSLGRPTKKARKIRAGGKSSVWQLWKLSLRAQPQQMLQLNSNRSSLRAAGRAASEFWVILDGRTAARLPVIVNCCFTVSCLCGCSDAFHLEIPWWSQKGWQGEHFHQLPLPLCFCGKHLSLVLNSWSWHTLAASHLPDCFGLSLLFGQFPQDWIAPEG